MSKILVLGRTFHPDKKETATDIYAGLLGHGPDAEITVMYYKDLIFDISNDKVAVWDAKTKQDLNSFDAVLMTNWFSHASVRKDMALALALYFQHHSIPVFNSEALYNRSSSKLSQMMLAALNNVPIPRTLFALSFKNLLNSAKNASEVALPLIFKDAQASRGHGNYLIKNWEDAEKLAAEHSEQHPFMVQSYVNSDGSDYRFFVAGEPRLIIHRKGNGESHLTNTSAGAETEVLEVDAMPANMLEDVKKVSKLLHREITGIDIILDNRGHYYFLEANPIPQIATGSNVERKLSAVKIALVEAAEARSKL